MALAMFKGRDANERSGRNLTVTLPVGQLMGAIDTDDDKVVITEGRYKGYELMDMGPTSHRYSRNRGHAFANGTTTVKSWLKKTSQASMCVKVRVRTGLNGLAEAAAGASPVAACPAPVKLVAKRGRDHEEHKVQRRQGRAKDTVKRLRATNELHEARYSTLARRYDGLAADAKTLAGKNVALTADAKTLAGKNVALTGKNVALTADAKTLARRYDGLAADAKTLAGKNNALAGKNVALAGKNVALAGKNVALTADAMTLARRYDGLAADAKTLAGKNHALAGKNVALAGKNVALAGKNVALTADAMTLARRYDGLAADAKTLAGKNKANVALAGKNKALVAIAGDGLARYEALEVRRVELAATAARLSDDLVDAQKKADVARSMKMKVLAIMRGKLEHETRLRMAAEDQLQRARDALN
jgi:hypothetical protein